MSLVCHAIILSSQRDLGQPSDLCRSYYQAGNDTKQKRRYDSYIQDRGGTPALNKRKLESIRTGLQNVEDSLFSNRPVYLEWLNPNTFHIVLGNADLAVFELNPVSSDVSKLNMETLLNSKAFVFSALTGIIAGEIIAFILQSSQILLVDGRKNEFRKNALLIDLPAQVPPHSGGGVDCFVDVNSKRDLLLVGLDRLILLYGVMTEAGSVTKVDLLKHLKLKGRMVFCQFSKKYSNQLYCVQQRTTDDGRRADLVSFEYFGALEPMKKHEWAKISVAAEVTAAVRSSDEALVVLACADGSLIVYNHVTAALRHAHPSKSTCYLVRWHPSGTMLVACFADGDIALFTPALHRLPLQHHPSHLSNSLNLHSRLTYQARVRAAEWSSASWLTGSNPAPSDVPRSFDILALVYDRGPVVVLRVELGCVSRGELLPHNMIALLIATAPLDHAVALLHVLHNPDHVYRCTVLLVTHLLALNTTHATRWAGRVLEHVWPLFADSNAKHHQHVRDLYRSYFHRLLSREDFDPAFEVAVALNLPDLYLDLYTWAMRCGEVVVADVAWLKASSHLSKDELMAFARPHPPPLYGDDKGAEGTDAFLGADRGGEQVEQQLQLQVQSVAASLQRAHIAHHPVDLSIAFRPVVAEGRATPTPLEP